MSGGLGSESFALASTSYFLPPASSLTRKKHEKTVTSVSVASSAGGVCLL